MFRPSLAMDPPATPAGTWAATATGKAEATHEEVLALLDASRGVSLIR